MGTTVRFRSTAARVLGAGTGAFAVIVVGTLVAAHSWSSLAAYGGVASLVGLAGWAVLWSPYVEVSDGGVELCNVLRTIRLPWPAINDVDGRYGLRLDTAYGRFTGWAAPAPSGRGRAHGQDSEAAALVRRRLEELRRAGHLENPRLESERADVTWHAPLIALASALALAAVVGPLIS